MNIFIVRIYIYKHLQDTEMIKNVYKSLKVFLIT